MSLIEGGIAFMGLLFATSLAGLTLWGRISDWLERQDREREKRFKQIIVDAITDQGLIKEGKAEDVWPNGSDNMPDFLLVLWEAIEATQGSLHALRRKVEEEHEPPKGP